MVRFEYGWFKAKMNDRNDMDVLIPNMTFCDVLRRSIAARSDENNKHVGVI